MDSTSRTDGAPEKGEKWRPDALVRIWAPTAFVLLGIVALGADRIRPPTDSDLWWHLRLGSEFLGEWSLRDPGSLTPFATVDWVPTQWTLEVLASLLVDQFGLASVAWLTALGVVALGGVVWAGNRRQANPLAAAIATGLTIGGTIQVLAPRPQLASLVLLAMVSNAWWRTAKDLRPRWWLIPLTWVWACTHGFWFVGVGLGAVVLVGLWADGRLARADVSRLALVPVASVVAAGVTPVGPALLLAPFRVGGVSDFIAEWQPPDFQSPYPVFVLAMVVAAVVHLARSRGAWTQVFVLVFALALLVFAARTVALAAIVLAPLVATALHAATAQPLKLPDRRERVAFTSGTAVAVAIITLLASVRGPFTYPHAGIDAALSGLSRGSVIFNEYSLGGWLSYRHPDLVHGVNGLTESFTPQYLGAYFDAAVLRPGWQEFLDERIGADVVVVGTGGAMAHQLRTNGGWTVVTEDAEFVVLERKHA